MLEIVTDEGKKLDVFNDMSFTLTLKNPLFQFTLDSGFAYDINFPLTTSNKKYLLNYAHRIQGKNTFSSHPLNVFFNGLKILEGNFVFKETAGSVINGNIAVSNGNLLSRIFKTKLNEINMGNKAFASEEAARIWFNANVNSFYPEVDFSLPMILDSDLIPEDLASSFAYPYAINPYDPEIGSYMLSWNQDPGFFSPQLYLCYVLKKLFNSLNYRYSDDVFECDSDYKKLLLLNIYNANEGLPYHDRKQGYQSHITNIQYQRHLPMVEISEFINGLQNMMNVKFMFRHDLKSVKLVDPNILVASPEFIDITGKVLKISNVSSVPSGFRISLTPDGNDSFYSYTTEFEGDLMARFGGTRELISDLPTYYIGYDFYFVMEDSNFYKWNVDTSAWVEADFDLRTAIFKPNEDLNIKSIFSSVSHTFSDNRTAIGNSAFDYMNLPPRLQFYRGMVWVEPTYQLPVSNRFLNNKNLEFDRYLHNNVYDNLFSDRWEPFLKRYLNTKSVSFTLILSPAEIKNFDFTRKYRIEGIDYMISELKIPISLNSIGICTAEAYKI